MIHPFTKPRTIAILFHVLIWSTLILLPYLVSSAANDYKIGDIPGGLFAAGGFLHAAIFYTNAFYLYPAFLNKRFWWLYLILSILLITGSFQLKYVLLNNFFPQVSKNANAVKFIFGPSVGIFIIGIVYRKVIDQIRVESEVKERRAAQFEAELKFLRSQINPHFLFNILTNLVSLARKKSEKLEQSLIMLSDLMRYSIYDFHDKKITLEREVEYLNGYLELQALRFGEEIKLNCALLLDEHNSSLIIEPMLLIPFVENAFKHGAGSCDQPWIDITLSVKGNTMTFQVVNNYESKSLTTSSEKSGIGISNVKSRLDLIYKDNYTLMINEDGHTFNVILTLMLV